MTEIRCMNSVEVDVTKLAWTRHGGLMKPAPAWISKLGPWIAKLSGSLNSVKVDVRKPAFDVTKLRSLVFEAWIPDAMKQRIDVAMLPTMT